jgi:formylglycine-generating enzyme required for sulfatase activity
MELNLGKGVKMSLVLIPAGKFTMGSQPGDEGKKPDELPPHEVTISMPFYMGIYEVRQQEYEAVTGANPSTDRSKNLPVHNVSWDDCMSFCKQASIKTGKTVRLPTEAEWEYACRAGTKTRFSFGDDAGDVRKYANYRDRSYTPVMTGVSKNDFPSDGHDKDAPVGTYKPNPWGLYDMHGNVNEWCSDWYGESYYASSPSVDPKGPADGDRKVQKGGSCVDDALYLRSARRCSNTPSKPHHMDIIPFGFGFRVVVEVGQ